MKNKNITLAWLLFSFALVPVLAFSQEARLEIVNGSDKFVGKYNPALSSRVLLKGSRGEVLSFQVKLPPGDCKTLSLSPLTNQATDSSIQLPVTLFKMETIRTSQPSFPNAFVGDHFDPLVPLAAAEPVCPSATTPTWLWAEFLIPKDTLPGSYNGNLVYGDIRTSISLTVWKMVIPDVPALPAYSPLSTYEVLVGHHGKWESGEGVLARQYRALLAEHRMYALGSYVKVPEVINKEGKDLIELYETPAKDQSFDFVNLQGRPADSFFEIPPVRDNYVSLSEAPKYLTAVENALQAISRPGKALMIVHDEPTEKDFSKIIAVGKLIEQYAPSVKAMVTTPFQEILQNYVDIFVPVMDQFDDAEHPAPEVYRRMQQEGKTVWWYISCLSHGCEALANSGTPDFVLDRQSVYVRSIAWLSMNYNIDAFYYYATTFAYGKYPKRDPWKDLWDFSGNGDGTLLYPGRPGEHGFTEHAPAPSIRLKAWREASYDAEYIKWMNAAVSAPAWWSAEFKKLVTSPRKWSKEYGAYQSLRDRAGDYLNSK